MPAPADLLITEYVEGTSQNKAIEIWNGTGTAIDLSQYRLELYSNGSATVSTFVVLSGMLAPGDVFVISRADADAAIQAVTDLNAPTVINFNGDDAIVLRKGGAGGTVIDSIGQVGTDPGAEWGTGLTSTADNTIRLKSTIDTGDTNTGDAFDPAVRFDGFATNTFSGLGAHTGPTGGGGDATVSVAATDAAATEGSAPAFQFTFTRSGGDTTQALTIDFTYGGGASAADFTVAGGGAAPTSIVFAANATTAVLNLEAFDDADAENAETVTVTVTDGAAYDVTGGPATATITSDEVPVTLISQVQGSGATTPLAAQSVTVEAVVTADFQNGDADATRELGGFWLQEQEGDYDADADTSEGVFVFQGTGPSGFDVNVGDIVRVTGTVSEAFGSTQITATSISLVSTGNPLPGATAITLATGNKEAVEGMLVTVPEALVISEQFEFDRLGEIRLYDDEGDGLNGAVAEGPDGRAFQYTQINEPTTGGAVAAYTAAIAARTIIYDDGLNGTFQPLVNPDGGGVYDTATAPQMGDRIVGLTGVLDFAFSNYRIRSTSDGENDFEDVNTREAAPADVGGSLKIGSFNVLNFFVTLDETGVSTDIGQDSRGADTQTEFDRQVQKLVTTIIALDADVLGLVEIENDFSTEGNPLADGNAVSYLVSQLNLALNDDVYSWVDPGVDFVGSDAIAVGFIYKNDVVEIAAGTTVDFDTDAVHNRPPVAVTFEEIATGGQFTAVVNHFKSKGSGTGANADQGDGQGASNLDRTLQAQALLDYVATNPTGTTDGDYILLGDFNAYFQEDPLDLLRGEGFATLEGPTSYSYTFGGQLGSLDHIFFNTSLAGQATGSTKWHVNSDEADALDYNLDADDTNVNTNRNPAIFDGTVPYRVSDHDPILLGLNLTPTNKLLVGDNGANTLTGRNGNDRLLGDGGGDTLTGGAGRDSIAGGSGDDTIDGGEGDDQLGGGSGDDTLDGGAGIDIADYRDKSVGVVLTLNGAVDALAAIGTETDTLRNVERVSGGTGADILTGDALANLLLGNGGADLLKGGGAVDTLDGGADADTADYGDETAQVKVVLNGATTVNVLVGGVREDVIRNIEGVLGGSAADVLYGDALVNVFRGAAGGDLLRGYGGNDDLFGGEDADILQGGTGEDELFGEAGADKLGGGDDADVLEGGTGNDSLSGEAGGDTFVFSRFDGLDAIRDFESADTIAFRAASFGLSGSPGDPAPVQFGAAAVGGAATFVYNAATKTVSWDSDGAGGAAAERLAILTTNDTVDASDFILI